MKLVKLFLFIAILVSALVGAVILLGDEAMLFGFLISVSLFGAVYWFSDKVVLKMCGAELLSVYHSPTLFAAVEEMRKKVRMPMPRIFTIPGETPNAFSTGRGRRTASIAFTEGILKGIEPDELRSVIAHELVHIKNGDALVGSFAATFAGFFGMGIGRSASSSLGETQGSRIRRFEKASTDKMKIFSAPLAAYLIRLLVNASREYDADERAANISGNPLSMANAIRTMEKKKYVQPMHTTPLAAHLFTVNPLTDQWAVRLFNTHPPMEKRIERLELMARRGVRA